MIEKRTRSTESKARCLGVVAALAVLWVLASACSEDPNDDTDAGDTDTESDTGTDTYPDLDDCAGGEGVYDPSSDLCWQDPPPDGNLSWQAAADTCDFLLLGGASDWRLPTISELRTLVRGCAATATGGGCWVNDECLHWTCWNDPCEGCDALGGPGSEGCFWDPALEGPCDAFYWSSLSYTEDPTYAWGVYFYYATVSTAEKAGEDFGAARCVRTGP